MRLDKSDLVLYAVTDRYWLENRKLEEDVSKAIEGGCTFIQLREKNLSYNDFKNEAYEIKNICQKHNVPFVINDNVKLALETDADGVHVGQSDMEASNVRNLLGDDKIIGVSVQNVNQALKAEAMGADYLGVGAVFPTDTKKDADYVSFEALKEICGAVSIPVIAIGGINLENVKKLKNSGICGIAVISAIFGEENIKDAASKLKKETEKMLYD